MLLLIFTLLCMGNMPFHLFGGEMGKLSLILLVASPTTKCPVSSKQHFTDYHNVL